MPTIAIRTVVAVTLTVVDQIGQDQTSCHPDTFWRTLMRLYTCASVIAALLLGATVHGGEPVPTAEPSGGVGRARVVSPAAATPPAPLSSVKPVSHDVEPATDAAANDAETCSQCGLKLPLCGCVSVRAWGDWLYWQPRGADLGYAYPTDEAFGRPLGPTVQVDHDYEPQGFRIGAGLSQDGGINELRGIFTYFNAGTSGSAWAPAGQTLQTLLLASPVPLNADAATTSFAISNSELYLTTWDLDYVHQICTPCTDKSLYGFVGARVGRLDQRVHVEYDRETVRVSPDLRGGGIRGGVGGSLRFGKARLFGSAAASVMATGIDVEYLQNNRLAGRVVDYRQDIDRVVPVVDLQLGIAFDITEHLSISAGYDYSVWFNVVTPEAIVDAAQSGDFSGDIEDDLTFDGAFFRVEARR